MKNQLSLRLALLSLLGGGTTSFLPSVSAQTPVVAPSATLSKSLEVQISATVKDGKNILVLDPVQPHFNVILRNISDKPMRLFEEWNSWGYGNLHLEITAVDGKTLPQVLTIQKGAGFWAANYASTEMLLSSQSLVREAYLHVPAAIRHPETPVTLKEMNRDLNAVGNNYWFFPFPNEFDAARRQAKTVTMKAVFGVKPEETTNRGAWTGRIESPLLTYEISWAAPRR